MRLVSDEQMLAELNATYDALGDNAPPVWSGFTPFPSRNAINAAIAVFTKLHEHCGFKKPDVDVRVPLKIIGKERARVVTQEGKKARAFTPERTVRFESDFLLACSTAMPAKPWDGPVRMETTIHVPHETKTGPCIGKPDLDNALKAIFDSLKGHAYVDDCQIWRETTEMLWAKEPLIHMRMWFDKSEDR